MQHINATEITTSLPARLAYLQSFLQFDPEVDGGLVHACKPVLGPLVNGIVDAVYDHLLKYDITATVFTKPQAHGQAPTSLDELGESENLKVRKDFLKGYLIRLASNTDWTPSSNFWTYLDGVGKAHTGGVGDQSGLKHRKNKPPLWVDYRDINLLLGWVENAVTDVVMGVESLDLETRVKILKALNKFWWIQNDLFARHYIDEGGPTANGEGDNTENMSRS
ncbi:uncharacterized protein HMPREF1541_08236 [Cyphellophora europaea CBS 101466]|uniref:Globin-sensor domain-containing protein n=1 Tax=Cyphellophora europaea (strain CBS 101466) TaxID=1220924 RepID=W2RLP8_CYPE1|nr:uncharacterized protein HMPREF1541_08236 [Cyphellophora europaea CBS 101466]ETN37245.1 hypothetical protein HMPREF1541_08236 [Cyphellophora europaea CBS 101466]